MSRSLTTALVLNLAGNLQSQANAFRNALGQLSTQGGNKLLSLKGAAEMSNRALDAMGNKYMAVLGGGAMGMAMRNVGQFETRLTRLGIAGNVTDQRLTALKNKIFEVSQERKIRIDHTEALAAVEAIVEKTGDLEFAEKNIRNVALAISATGAAGMDIGDMMAEFQKMGIKAPQEVLKAIDVLNVQGKEGAFTLENLAKLGPRVVSAYTAGGRGGVAALREMGAALQMIRQGTGSSEMAASAFEATMRTMLDPQKIKELQKLGINVFDPEKLKAGTRELRPINELMQEIITTTKGDATKLGQVFDAEAIRAFNAAGAEFKRTGSVESLQRYMNVQADGTQTMRDSERAAKTYAASMAALGTAWAQFADNNLAGPVQSLADGLNSLEPGTIQNWFNLAKNVTLVVGGLIALQKAKQAIGFIQGLLNRGGAGALGGVAGAGGRGGLGGAPGAAVPVYIVDGPMSVLGGAGGAQGAPGSPGSRGGTRMEKLARGAGVAQALLAAGGVGYTIGSAISDNYLKDEKGRNNSAGNAIGGTLVRMMAWLGNDKAAEVLKAERDAAKQKMQGEMRIVVDDNRVRVAGMKGDNLALTAETGRNMGP